MTNLRLITGGGVEPQGGHDRHESVAKAPPSTATPVRQGVVEALRERMRHVKPNRPAPPVQAETPRDDDGALLDPSVAEMMRKWATPTIEPSVNAPAKATLERMAAQFHDLWLGDTPKRAFHHEVDMQNAIDAFRLAQRRNRGLDHHLAQAMATYVNEVKPEDWLFSWTTSFPFNYLELYTPRAAPPELRAAFSAADAKLTAFLADPEAISAFVRKIATSEEMARRVYGAVQSLLRKVAGPALREVRG